MGHKAHPVGLRLGLHRKWKSNWFFESINYTKLMHVGLNIEKFITGFLYFLKLRKTLVLKSQLVKLPSNKIFVFIFYYRFRKKWKKTFYKSRNELLWKENLQKILKKKKKLLWQRLNKQITNKLNIKNSNSLVANFFIKKSLFFLIKKKTFLQLTLIQLKSLNKIFIKKFIILLKFKHLIIKSFKHFFKINLKFFYNKLNKNLTCLKYIIKKNLFLLKNTLLNFKNLKVFFFNLKFFKKILLKKNKPNIFWYQKIILNKIYIVKLINIYFKKYFKKIKLNSKLRIKKYFKYLTFVKKNFNLKKKRKFLKYKYVFNKKTKNLKIFIMKPSTRWSKYLKNSNSKKQLLKIKHPIAIIKKFLSKITNLKFNLIFINTLSFAKFFYLIQNNINKSKKERFNVLQIQRMMLSRYKYHAIFIKDFVHLAFITILLKNPVPLVNFIGEQFKRLPKNRKQLKLLKFLNQSIQIFCKQREEILGFKFQIHGRLNRRRRTHQWTFQKGILKLQTYTTRVEYGYSEGFTRRGLIGIHFWIFYDNSFNDVLKKKLIQYFFYSKYKSLLNQKFLKEKSKNKFIFQKNKKKINFKNKNNNKFNKKKFKINPNVKTKSKKISKK